MKTSVTRGTVTLAARPILAELRGSLSQLENGTQRAYRPAKRVALVLLPLYRIRDARRGNPRQIHTTGRTDNVPLSEERNREERGADTSVMGVPMARGFSFH